MGERYWAKPTGLRFGSPDLIEYERADPPTPKQARLIAKLERSIEQLKNGRYRLDEADGVQEQIEELEYDLFRATPHDKRITPLTDMEKAHTAVFAESLLSPSILATALIESPEHRGPIRFGWVNDVSTALRAPNP